VLRSSGYRVELASTGKEALEKSLMPDCRLVVLDLGMPGIDGWEAIRWLRDDARTRGIRIVVVTAITVGGLRAKPAGCDAFLVKPCLPATLLEVVRGLLGS
jgi:CheY-like chemotaxis protein